MLIPMPQADGNALFKADDVRGAIDKYTDALRVFGLVEQAPTEIVPKEEFEVHKLSAFRLRTLALVHFGTGGYHKSRWLVSTSCMYRSMLPSAKTSLSGPIAPRMYPSDMFSWVTNKRF